MPESLWAGGSKREKYYQCKLNLKSMVSSIVGPLSRIKDAEPRYIHIYEDIKTNAFNSTNLCNNDTKGCTVCTY